MCVVLLFLFRLFYSATPTQTNGNKRHKNKVYQKKKKKKKRTNKPCNTEIFKHLLSSLNKDEHFNFACITSLVALFL